MSIMDAIGLRQRLHCILSLCLLAGCLANKTQSRTQVYISTLNGTALRAVDKNDIVRSTFNQYGELADVWLSKHHYGFLTFKDESAAVAAADASPIHVESQHDVICSPAKNRNEDGKTIYLSIDGKASLSAMVTDNELRSNLSQFGIVAKVWVSEKNFAFVMFENASDAARAVAASPLRLTSKHDIVCRGVDIGGAKKNKLSGDVAWAKKNKVSDDVGTFLRKMEDNGRKPDWVQYISSDQFKEDLKDIAQTVDPAVQQRIRDLTCATTGVCSSTGTEDSKFPLVLFHGPPGTGKTEAMRLLASESGLTPWVVDMKGLNLGYGAEDFFAKSLKQASELSDAIVFFDECERLFTRRSVLGESAAMMAQVQKRLIASFIEFADGLETKNLMNQRVIFVFASNLKDDLDPAVLDRVWKDLLFELPGQNEFTTWWSRNAKHLNDKEHAKLGALSVGLSYRKVKQIAQQVLVRAARKEVSLAVCLVPNFEDYELEFARSRDELSNAWWQWVMEWFGKLGSIAWALRNFDYLFGRLASLFVCLASVSVVCFRKLRVAEAVSGKST